MAYTGLGRIGRRGVPTDAWLVNALSAHVERPVPDILEQLAAGAAREVGLPESDDDGLCFVGAGFNAGGEQFFFTVSNMHDREARPSLPVTSEFRMCLRTCRRFVGIFGNEPAAEAVQDRLFQQLNNGELFGLQDEELQNLTVAAIREAAAGPVAQGSISADCMAIVLRRNRAAMVRHYPASDHPPTIDGPCLVRPRRSLPGLTCVRRAGSNLDPQTYPSRIGRNCRLWRVCLTTDGSYAVERQ